MDFSPDNSQISQYYSLLRFHPDSLISFITDDTTLNTLRNFDSLPSRDSSYSWLVDQFQFPFGIRSGNKKELLKNSFASDFAVSSSIISPNITNLNISVECSIGLASYVKELQNSTLWALKSVKLY